MKIVTLLKLPAPDGNPWRKSYYMCGSCAKPIALTDVEDHVKEVHGADGANLVEVATQAVEENIKKDTEK